MFIKNKNARRPEGFFEVTYRDLYTTYREDCPRTAENLLLMVLQKRIKRP